MFSFLFISLFLFVCLFVCLCLFLSFSFSLTWRGDSSVHLLVWPNDAVCIFAEGTQHFPPTFSLIGRDLINATEENQN